MEQVMIDDKLSKVRDWPIVLTAATGLFLSTLDTGIINVALPTLNQTFHATAHTTAWTITLYLLLLSTTIVWFGRISDRIGRVKVYISGLLVFGMASILCGYSTSILQLTAFRGMQGIGAAMLQATSTAIITTAIPVERRGIALGTLGTILGLGPVLGPSVGGVILSFASWRWIFWLNVPVCIIGIWGCRTIPKSVASIRRKTGLDMPGNTLLGLVIFSLLYGLGGSSHAGTGYFGQSFDILICGVCLIGYVVWESRAADPIIQLSLFRRLGFCIPLISVFTLGLATAVAFIIPPYFLEQVPHLPPWQTGLVNLAAPLGLVFLAKLSGKQINRFETTRLMGFGLVLMFISLTVICALQREWDASFLFGLLFAYGAGAGIFVPANLSAVMEAVGSEAQGTIGAIQRMVQNIGIAIGTSVSSSLMDAHAKHGVLSLVTAFQEAFLFAGLFVLVSLAATVRLPR